MVIGFLFWFLLAGIIIACIQDMKRTEIDNWLNFLLLTGGSVFLIFSAIFSSDYWIVIYGLFSFALMFALSNGVYYSRIYAGGDYKLLVALFAFFVGVGFMQTAENIGVFVVLLFFAGSVWGLGYSVFLYARNFKSVNREIEKFFGKFEVRIAFLAFIALFVLSYFNWIFLFLSILLALGVFLFIFTKSIEKTAMTKTIGVGELREGDWLVSDVRVGKMMLKAKWEGVSKKEIAFLRKLKNKKIRIKQGIPFTPAFLISFLTYGLFYEEIFAFIKGIFGF